MGWGGLSRGRVPMGECVGGVQEGQKGRHVTRLCCPLAQHHLPHTWRSCHPTNPASILHVRLPAHMAQHCPSPTDPALMAHVHRPLPATTPPRRARGGVGGSTARQQRPLWPPGTRRQWRDGSPGPGADDDPEFEWREGGGRGAASITGRGLALAPATLQRGVERASGGTAVTRQPPLYSTQPRLSPSSPSPPIGQHPRQCVSSYLAYLIA